MTDLEKVFEGKLLIRPDAIKPLKFFSRKYKGVHLFSQKDRQALYPDIMRVCKFILNDPYFTKVIKTYREAKTIYEARERARRTDLGSTINFLNLIDKLECFYEINSNSGPGTQDKRIHIFEKLKGNIVKGIVFLERRTETMSLHAPPKNPQDRRQVKGKKIGNLKRVLFHKLRQENI